MPGNESDIQAVLARRHDNGADYWATPDGRCYVGNPFSTLACLGMLHELGVPADHEAVATLRTGNAEISGDPPEPRRRRGC